MYTSQCQFSFSGLFSVEGYFFTIFASSMHLRVVRIEKCHQGFSLCDILINTMLGD